MLAWMCFGGFEDLQWYLEPQRVGFALPRVPRGACWVCRGRTGARALSPARISPSPHALIVVVSTVFDKCSAFKKKCPIFKIICIYRYKLVYLYIPILLLMIIQLVSCSCVDNMQYYDAVVCFSSIEFTLTSVYYDVLNHVWSVKLPDNPLFETRSYNELISYLIDIIRELFYR